MSGTGSFFFRRYEVIPCHSPSASGTLSVARRPLGIREECASLVPQEVDFSRRDEAGYRYGSSETKIFIVLPCKLRPCFPGCSFGRLFQ